MRKKCDQFNKKNLTFIYLVQFTKITISYLHRAEWKNPISWQCFLFAIKSMQHMSKQESI